MALDPRYLLAEQLGIRLETVGGLAIWEAAPVYKHQKAVDRIRASIRANQGGCSCVHAADVYVQFPDRSLKRPDVALFCREPSEEEDAITLLLEAREDLGPKAAEGDVVEVIGETLRCAMTTQAPCFSLSLAYHPRSLAIRSRMLFS